MLTIRVPKSEFFNNDTQEFINVKETTLQLEHSLISLKKWEQKWHKPFLNQKPSDTKSDDEIRDYIRCMTINNVDPNVYLALTDNNIKEITDYIDDPMTATKFTDNSVIGAAKNSNEYITNETIYYWMITLNIPVEFQKWHLQALLTLIRFVNVKNQPAKKMSAKEAAAMRKAENARRKASMHSRG